MSKVRDHLRPYWLSGLNEINAGGQQSFKGWLEEKQYVVNAVDLIKPEIQLYPADMNAVVSSFALDIDRFAAAALETFAGMDGGKEFGKSRAWPLIRGYYAAFYSAHGLCRIFGRCVSHLDRNHCIALRNTIQASGFDPTTVRISERNYLFYVRSNLGIVALEPLGGGSHEDMWFRFELLLRELQSSVLAAAGATSAKQEVFEFLDSIREIINSDSSGGNWLSKVRNNINYRHDYGAWYPHGEGRHWADVEALFRSFLADPVLATATRELKIIVRFAKGCALIVGLFFELIRDLVHRHPTNKSFLTARTSSIYNAVKGPI